MERVQREDYGRNVLSRKVLQQTAQWLGRFQCDEYEIYVWWCNLLQSTARELGRFQCDEYELYVCIWRKWTLKLGDFDSVLQYDEAGVSKDQSHCSHDYRPPELLLEDKYYLRSDMWSVGCLFYEMVTAESLFDVDDDYDSDYTGGGYDNGDESSSIAGIEKSTPIPIPVSADNSVNLTLQVR